MFILYEIIYIIGFICYLPILFLKGKWHEHFAMRFSLWPHWQIQALKEKKNIWVHAVSVGEVLAVQGVILGVKKLWPEYRIVISSVTKTGYQLACSKFPDDIVVYAPLDFRAVVFRYIHFIKPKIYIAAETEIWPNLFYALSKKKIPIVLINGRISDGSFKRYQRINLLLKEVLADVLWAGMQTQEDADRIAALGVPKDRALVMGNMKFDGAVDVPGWARSSFGYTEDDLIFIAGSTHPGEEEIILDIASEIAKENANFRLIIAPRHIERSFQVMEMVRARGFRALRFSAIEGARQDAHTVVVVDTIGHLKSLYSIATLVFVGKSLTAHGGQNIIEPAFWGKSVIVGPYVENFKDIIAIFLKRNAVVQVFSAESFGQEIRRLLADPKERERLGEAAKTVVHDNRGVTEKTLQLIQKVIG